MEEKYSPVDIWDPRIGTFSAVILFPTLLIKIDLVLPQF
jgi:hypothetical protein